MSVEEIEWIDLEAISGADDLDCETCGAPGQVQRIVSANGEPQYGNTYCGPCSVYAKAGTLLTRDKHEEIFWDGGEWIVDEADDPDLYIACWEYREYPPLNDSMEWNGSEFVEPTK